MAMPDVFAVNLIFLSGDIHLQPGLSTREKGGSNETTNKGNKSTQKSSYEEPKGSHVRRPS